MQSLNSVERQFAYDSLRAYNYKYNIGFDHSSQDEAGTAMSYIPFSYIVQNYEDSTNKMDIQNEIVRFYTKQLDEDPTNELLWINYILVYENLADHAETKKEKVIDCHTQLGIVVYVGDGVSTYSGCLEEDSLQYKTEECLV